MSDRSLRSTRSITLRSWQHDALNRFLDRSGENFMTVACPGAGKTTFALTACRHWLAGERRPVVIVVPTRHLKIQWADAATRMGFHLEPEWDASSGRFPSDMHGVIVTYAQVASAQRTIAPLVEGGIVVLDEIHHAGGDKSWGEGVEAAFINAECRLLLSGTPFRSDDRPIPFVNYTLGDHGEAVADFEYDYGRAIIDGGVVRPVFFPRFDGHMEWIGADGEHREAGFSDDVDVDDRGARLRTALSPDGEWLDTIITKADERLRHLRRTDPRAAGLVIAVDQEHARRIAGLIARRTGVSPSIALSDDPNASEVIDRFATSDDAWVVAVRMISEGVDIPRLRVGVYATTTVTSLFFRQAVGRIARWTPGLRSQKAYFFVPDDPRLRYHAATIAEQRRHSIAKRDSAEGARSDDALDDLRRAVRSEEQPSLFEALSARATDTAADDGLDDGEDLVVGEEGLEGLAVDLPPAPPLPGRDVDGMAAIGDIRSRHANKKELRKRNADRVAELVRACNSDHRAVNAELNRRSGVDRIAEADVRSLQKRLDVADRWLESLRSSATRGS